MGATIVTIKTEITKKPKIFRFKGLLVGTGTRWTLAMICVS